MTKGIMGTVAAAANPAQRLPRAVPSKAADPIRQTIDRRPNSNAASKYPKIEPNPPKIH